MTKKDAVKLFGKTQKSLADAVGVSKSAVSQWPDELPSEIVDRVVGAAVRLGKMRTEDNPAFSDACRNRHNSDAA